MLSLCSVLLRSNYSHVMNVFISTILFCENDFCLLVHDIIEKLWQIQWKHSGAFFIINKLLFVFLCVS